MDLEAIFRTAHLKLKPRSPVPRIEAEFFPFVGLSHTARLRDNVLKIRVSDLFVDAPRDVYESLAWILLSKLYRRKVDSTHDRTYRLFTLTEGIQEKTRQARSIRGRRHAVRAHGRFVDLGRVFDRLNEKYFERLLVKPRLAWTIKKARTVLGRYDATQNTIFLSCALDSPDVPSHVVDYILFHEMLHLKHQSRIDDSRVLVHTRKFKQEERRFEQYEKAQRWLNGIRSPVSGLLPESRSTEPVENPVEKAGIGVVNQP